MFADDQVFDRDDAVRTADAHYLPEDSPRIVAVVDSNRQDGRVELGVGDVVCAGGAKAARDIGAAEVTTQLLGAEQGATMSCWQTGNHQPSRQLRLSSPGRKPPAAARAAINGGTPGGLPAKPLTGPPVDRQEMLIEDGTAPAPGLLATR